MFGRASEKHAQDIAGTIGVTGISDSCEYHKQVVVGGTITGLRPNSLYGFGLSYSDSHRKKEESSRWNLVTENSNSEFGSGSGEAHGDDVAEQPAPIPCDIMRSGNYMMTRLAGADRFKDQSNRGPPLIRADQSYKGRFDFGTTDANGTLTAVQISLTPSSFVGSVDRGGWYTDKHDSSQDYTLPNQQIPDQFVLYAFENGTTIREWSPLQSAMFDPAPLFAAMVAANPAAPALGDDIGWWNAYDYAMGEEHGGGGFLPVACGMLVPGKSLPKGTAPDGFQLHGDSGADSGTAGLTPGVGSIHVMFAAAIAMLWELVTSY